MSQNLVKEAFSKAKTSYDSHSEIQAICAGRLAKSLDPWKDWVPAGAVLELGAGTGLLTQYLVEMYPTRKLVITDFSEELLAINEAKHKDSHPNIHFQLLDANNPEIDEQFALITHNFLTQWLDQPEQAMIKHSKLLTDGGLILCCFPSENSFPEWQTQCYRHGYAFTANKMPNPEKIGIALSFEPVLIDLHEDNETVNYHTAWEFFDHFRKIGANVPTNSQKLSAAQLRRIITEWPKNAANKIHITYHTAFMAIKKDG